MNSSKAHHIVATRSSLYGVGLATIIAFMLLGGMLLPAFLGATGTAVIMEAFSTLCHQITERSPHLHGQQLAACHRCLGIYLGLVAGAAAMAGLMSHRKFIRSHTLWIVVAAAAPAAIDWFAGFAGLWMNTSSTRIVTGLLFGIAAGICMARAFADTFEQKRKRAHEPPTAEIASQT